MGQESRLQFTIEKTAGYDLSELTIETINRLFDQPSFHETALRAVQGEGITREAFFEQTARAVRAAYEAAVSPDDLADHHAKMGDAASSIFMDALHRWHNQEPPEGVSRDAWIDVLAGIAAIADNETSRHRAIAEKLAGRKHA
jgi:hypothetical protein